jgi:hypothetical protein
MKKHYRLYLYPVDAYSKYVKDFPIKIPFYNSSLTVSKIPTCRPSTAAILITAFKLS